MYKRKKDDDEDDEYYDSGGDADDDFIVPDEGTNPRKRGRGGQAKGKRFGGAKGKGSYYEESAGLQDYSRTLKLKSDHEKRPIWITKDNLIILEAFSPLYQQAYDFLVAIAEPESRPEFIHTYRLTENSLYAAVSISIDTESIIKVLNRLCKTDVPSEVIEYIRDCTITFGKAKLVLKDNKFYVESQSADVLRQLLENPTIRSARVLEIDSSTNTLGNSADGFQQSSAPEEDLRNLEYAKLGTEEIGDDDEDDDEDISEEMIGNGIFGKKQRLHTVSFMIEQKSVQVKTRLRLDYIQYLSIAFD